jgi:hypothetical protein
VPQDCAHANNRNRDQHGKQGRVHDPGKLEAELMAFENPLLPKINLAATVQQQWLPIYRPMNRNCATSRPKDRFVHAQGILC